MSRYTSLISDYPAKGRIYESASYCVVSFGVIPYLMSFFGWGFQLDENLKMWSQIGYYIINFLAAIIIFRRYLKDSFFYVQLEPRKFAGKVADGVVLMLMVAAVAVGIGAAMDNSLLMQSAAPTTEFELFALPSVIISRQPVLGMLCMVLLTPFSTSLLYYATGFARTCSSKPVRAYLQIALLSAVPRIVNALTFWSAEEQILLYLAHLPIHLIACRTYQKADSVWAPIAAHMVVNLIASIAMLFVFVL